MKPGYLTLTAAACIAVAAIAGTANAQAVVGADGQPYCREYTQKVMIGGAPHTMYGTSCMQPDGSWEIVSQQPDTPPPASSPVMNAPPAPPYVVAGPPVYYGAPYYYTPGPVMGFSLDFGHGWYHDHYHGGHSYHGDRDDHGGDHHWHH